MVDVIAHPLAMLVYGMAANLVAALAEASAAAGKPVDPRAYVRGRPYRVALGAIAGLAGYGALADTGQLTGVAAFGVGYMGSDALAKIAAAASNRFQKL